MRATSPGILLLLLVGFAAATPALANVTASLGASQVAAGDTVQLTLEHDGQTSGQPDVAPLEQDFDILGTSSSTNIELINGNASEKTEVVLTLAPKSTGHLTIPALSWDGEQSQPLSLTVTGPGSTAQPDGSGASPAAKIFIETSASPEQPYVEAAVQLTVRLFTSETLYHPDLEMPESSDFVVKQVGSDVSSEAERNGRPYQVVTRQYLLFPLHSGKLTMQGPVLDAEVAVNQPRSPYGNDPYGGFFGGPAFGMLQTVRPLRLHGNPIVLSVRPRPAGAVSSYWLPARNVQLTAGWNPTQLSAQAGDPVTLDLDLQATGLTAAQLPDLSSLLSVPSGLKAYPDQPKLDDSAQDGELIGSRDQTIAFMADSPGHYTIPALTVKWWDTQSNQLRTATLPARTLTILPVPGSAAAPTAAPAATASPPASRIPPPPAAAGTAPAPGTARAPLPGSPTVVTPKPAPVSSPSPWEWISIGLALAWLATLAAWLLSRRPRAAPAPTRDGGPRFPAPSATSSKQVSNNPRQLSSDPAKERAAFRAACEANNARAARAHLLAWTAALWGAVPAGINAITARIGDTTVAGGTTATGDATVVELLRDLDRACYAGGAWQGHALAAALTELPGAPGKTSRQRAGLAPLYR